MKKQNKDGLDISLLKENVVLPSPSPSLVARILADAEATLAPKSWKTIVWPFGPVWKPAGVLAASIALGAWVGIFAMPLEEDLMITEIETLLAGAGL